VARYRLLQTHYVNDRLLEAGSVVTTGAELPNGWLPTGSVEPLDADALAAFYAAGPQDCELARVTAVGRGVSVPLDAPVTFWKLVSGGRWQLTGLGAALPPVERRGEEER
jgi:hypothetical protein